MSKSDDDEARAAALEIYRVVSPNPNPFPITHVYINDLWKSGSRSTAIKLAIIALRSEPARPELQVVAADMLDAHANPGPVGRKPNVRDSRWMDIGAKYDQLKNAQVPSADIVSKVAHDLGVSIAVAARGRTFYLKVMKYLDELIVNNAP